MRDVKKILVMAQPDEDSELVELSSHDYIEEADAAAQKAYAESNHFHVFIEAQGRDARTLQRPPENGRKVKRSKKDIEE